MPKHKKTATTSFIKSLQKPIKFNDQRPMNIWWKEFKEEEKQLEERKFNRIFLNTNKSK